MESIEASKGPLNPNAEEFKPSFISNPTPPPIMFPFPLPPPPYEYYPQPQPQPQPPMMLYFHHLHHILSPLPPFKSFPPFNFPKSDHISLPRADHGLGLITSPTSPSSPPTLTTTTTTAPPQLHPANNAITRISHKSRNRFLWVEKKNPEIPALNPDRTPTPLSAYPFGVFTSLMIRNIPVRLCRRELMRLLDEHCRLENENLSLSSPADISEPFSMFDFLYLPIDFKRKGNLGYAFVNFTTWQGASRLYNSWKGMKWEISCFCTKKICDLHPAKFQGAQLKNHFEGSKFECESDEYLPVKISPARDGNNGERTKLITVGTRIF